MRSSIELGEIPIVFGPTTNIVNQDEYRGFWITIKDGILSFGEEDKVQVGSAWTYYRMGQAVSWNSILYIMEQPRSVINSNIVVGTDEIYVGRPEYKLSSN